MNDFNNGETSYAKLNTYLLVIGIGIIVIGCLAAVENLVSIHLYGFRPIRLWPLIIVALGTVKIIENKFRSMSGWIIAIFGFLLLVYSIGGRSFGDLFGPGILVVIGVFIVFYAVKRQRKVPPELQKSREFALGTAILSAFNYRPSGGQFNGGAITAIFGGFDLDLRQTTMKHDSARVDVFVLCGGGEIIVPEGWEVAVQVSAIVGAVDSKKLDPPLTDAKRPKLLITGTVLFGGIEVK